MSSRGVWFRTLLGAAAVSLVAACGASASTSSSPSGSSSGKGAIKVAVILPFTGPEGFIGPAAMQGYNLALNVINAAGGVLGRPLSYITEDTAGDPGDAVTAVSKAIHVDNAVALLGPTTITAGASLPEAIAAKKVDIVAGGSTAFDHETSPYFFRLTVSDGVMAGAMVKYALSKGWTRAVNVFVEQPAATSVEGPLAQTYKAHGGTMLGTVNLAVAQTSYRSAIEKIYAMHPQVIFSQVDPTTAGVLFPEIQSLGLMNVPWVMTNTADTTQFYQAVGSSIATDGLISAAQSISVTGIGATTFAKEYEATYHTNNFANNANNSYDSAMALALAIDKAGSTNSQAIIKALPEIANGPGTLTASYAEAVKLIKEHKPVQFAFSASAGGFNQYHNVFGPFAILQFQSGGSTKTITQYPASVLKPYSVG